MRKITKSLATVAVGGTLALAPMATASAQPTVIVGGGLVDLTVSQVLNNNDVRIVRDVTVNLAAALNVAANVCDTTVAVLADEFQQDGAVNCTNAAQDATATITPTA